MQGEAGASPLGRALAAMEAEVADKGPDVYPPLMAAQSRAMLVGYDHRWAGEPLWAEAVESEFLLPIVNPDTGQEHPTFTHAGKVDGIVTDGKGRWLLEHKTSSESGLDDPFAPYWRRLLIDAQISAYLLGQWQEQNKLDGVLYDVVRKPTIRPRKLTKAEVAGIVSGREYFGYEVDPSTAADVAAGRVASETPDLYELRLAAEYVSEPEKNYQRRPVVRLDREVLEFARELWGVTQEIAHTRATGAHYRNSGACMSWGVPCQYLGICSGQDQPESDRWTRREVRHPELPMVSAQVGDSPNVLTYSRMQTYKLCKRKHLYQYEMGLTRARDEDSDALRLGALVHIGLEAWWLSQPARTGADEALPTKL